MHGGLLLLWFLFTAGMALAGVAFLSYLREAIENAELIEGYK